MISIHTRRELALTLASRYGAARRPGKTRILDEFVATTGYARKYAIRFPSCSPGPARS